MLDKLITYLINLLLAMVAVYTQNVDAVIFSLVLAFVLVGIDFLTGVSASLWVDGVGIKSKRLRWSFVKTLVYTLVMLSTLGIGVFLHLIDDFISPTPHRSDILTATLVCVKYEAYVAAWVEVVSILENLLRMFPDNRFLKYIHYIVAVEFVKKIPKLTEVLKDKTEKKTTN